MLRTLIRHKLQSYRIPLSQPDNTLPEKLSQPRSVAVIGGGIAGMSAAANLAERGFEVHLYEKERYLGGKIGSWEFQSHGQTLRTEHGFHGFFRQYYNLREFLHKIGADRHLIPIDDYTILYDKNKKQGFRNLAKTPLLNILSLRRYGMLDWKTFVHPRSLPFVHLLAYHPQRTFQKFDGESFASFAARTGMNRYMRLVFNSFARAFFAEPEDMSMAELIKSFHFYFLSNEDGLIYDVLDSDFQYSFISYVEKFLYKYNAVVYYATPVETIATASDHVIVNGRRYDYAVLCTDVKHTKRLVENSPELKRHPLLYRQLSALKHSGRYAVLRLWTDRFEADKSLPFFVFTDRLKCLDSVTLYHKMERESEAWSRENQGGIFELHSYALPHDLTDDSEIQACLLRELYHYFPELEGMKILHTYFQHRDDFPGFHVNQYAGRPTVKTEAPRLFLAGDWVKMDNCTMLMEAAYTSGALAANYIMTDEGLRENALWSVPLKGIFA
ncbi:MAG: FAD-dependent oxidoreductase [Chitinophagales bacterium]|nr:FAD-dependent oxidoreductase [Chitinophagales bacterium]MDW8418483.1 FAD-dependent oxidoreductase [Chitinophagales bacterium]